MSHSQNPTELEKLEDRVNGVTFATFIDNNYLIRAYHSRNFAMDFKKLRQLIETLPGQSHSLNVFVASTPGSKEDSFITLLNRTGFKTFPCPVQEFPKDDREGPPNNKQIMMRKTSLETIFVTHLMKLADNVKHFIIIADNWLYVDAIEHIKNKGAAVTFLLDEPWSKSMSDVAHNVVNFLDESIVNLIEKDEKEEATEASVERIAKR